MSKVVAMLTWAGTPASVRKTFSAEVDGFVTRCPAPSSISQSRQNSAAPAMIGQAKSRSQSLSPPNA